jgi:hypothetical protein
MSFARSPYETALDHLGAVLFMLADLHRDDRCQALEDALNFYNAVRPMAKVRGTGVAEARLVITLSG